MSIDELSEIKNKIKELNKRKEEIESEIEKNKFKEYYVLTPPEFDEYGYRSPEVVKMLLRVKVPGGLNSIMPVYETKYSTKRNPSIIHGLYVCKTKEELIEKLRGYASDMQALLDGQVHEVIDQIERELQ